MSNLESGFKWWIRYVIVPLVAGGGVIALIATALKDDKKAEPPVPVVVNRGLEAPMPVRAQLTVAVEPDTVGLKSEEIKAVNYRFREQNGVAAVLETQDVRWVLLDGREISQEQGNRILGGSFAINAKGEHVLEDNVLLPMHIAEAVRAQGQDYVSLQTTYRGKDANNQKVELLAILRIAVTQ